MISKTGKLGSTRCVIRKFPRLHRFTLHLISVAIYVIAFGRIILADSIILDMSKWIWIIMSTVIMVCLWRMWCSSLTVSISVKAEVLQKSRFNLLCNQNLSVWKQLLLCNYYCFHMEVPFECQSHIHVHERFLNANRIALAIIASINIRAANWLYTSEQSRIADDLSRDTFNKYDKLSSLFPLVLLDVD